MVTQNDDIQAEVDIFRHADHLVTLIDSLPQITLVLNEDKRIVAVNKKMLDSLGVDDMSPLLGKRPGEVMGCTQAQVSGACGQSERCKFCGCTRAVDNCIANNTSETGECGVVIQNDNSEAMLEFRVTASPFNYATKRFVLVFLQDINQEKHKERMERVFFHDVINTVNSLTGLIEILKEEEEEAGTLSGEKEEVLNLLERITDNLKEEILFQMDIIKAECGELLVREEFIDACSLLEEVSEVSKFLKGTTKRKQLEIHKNSPSNRFKTDHLLARRVLVNMVKNAYEATDVGGTVKFGVEKLDHTLRFWVWNDAVLSSEQKNRIFQRSFSTKGTGRGIGTYSMKLFMTRYLRGSIHFTSSEGEGTTFYADFPL